jgi:RNA polymerase sigma-70 factor, ECF subfamily
VTAAAPSRREDLERVLAADGDRLYGLALRVTRTPDLAADAVHEGFASALQGIDGFRGEASISTWLYRIVYRKAIDMLRRRGREEPLGDEENGGADSLESEAAWSRPAEEILMGAETRNALEAALAVLSPVQRAAFELREIDQRPTEEVADILGLPPGTVRVYLHRARMKLRAILGPLFRETHP